MLMSVIIPVFKVEKYLQQCIDSILCQSYRDLELILVDDGSPDKCPHICEEYAMKDERIIVIHKKNGGLSDARNVGICAASGEYILFVDGDDWLHSKEDLSLLADRAFLMKADVINFSYTKIYESSGKVVPCLQQQRPMPCELTDKKEQAAYLTSHGLYIASACNKLIRLDCLKSKMLFFEVGETSEDVVWCLRLMIAAKSLDYFNRNIYCYRQRVGSITQTLSLKNSLKLAEQVLTCVKLTLDAGDQGEACRYYTAYQLAAFMKVQTFAEEYPQEGVSALQPYAWLLKYHAGNRKLMALRAMTLVFGFSGACRILYCVYGAKHGQG